MFDYHMHSKLSFDSKTEPLDSVRVAEQMGLLEICFTDHYDFNDFPQKHHDLFSIEDYRELYDSLDSDKVKIRRGVEFGLTHWNQSELAELVKSYDFDFVLGSVHYAGGYDPYFAEFWEHNDANGAFEKCLLQTVKCVKAHSDFDVLGHINYVCKSPHNPTHKPIYYRDFPDIFDEIMKTLIEKGKGMEINTSGVDRVGDFLPSIDYIKRFRELGGEIVTVGSDAHTPDRVGQYTNGAIEIAKEVFGYVCTFEKRKPIFHKL